MTHVHWLLFFYVTHVGTEMKHEAITGVTNASGLGKPFTVGKQLLAPWRTPSLRHYLLDVNSSPSKHIHKLRVLSALLIAVPKTEISIVSPRVYFSWVCNEEENTITSTVTALPPPEA